jgi:hypothetical protein
MYTVCCAFIVYSCILARFDSFPLLSQIIHLSALFFINFQTLKHYCLIVVQYSHPGNVFLVFQSRKEVTIPSPSFSLVNKHVPDCLSTGFSKAYCHHRH